MKLFCFIFILIVNFVTIRFASCNLETASPNSSDDQGTLIIQCEHNPNGWPGLHWAIWKLQREDIALKILELFPEQINALSPDIPVWEETSYDYVYVHLYNKGYSALELAVRKGQNRLVQVLLENGANPDIKRTHNEDWSWATFDETTPLSWAIKGKNLEAIELLLAHGASTEKVYRQTQRRERPGRSYNAMMYAMEHFNEDQVLKIIIQHQMKTDHVDFIHQDVIDLFKKYTSEVYANCGPWPALHHAFHVGAYEDALVLMEYGANPYERYLSLTFDFPAKESDQGRPPPLHHIVWSQSDSRFLELLLEKNIFSEEILLRAIKENRQDIFQKVLAKGVKSEQAVGIACENRNVEILSDLIRYDFSIEDQNILRAIQLNDTDMLNLFMEAGYNIPSHMITEELLCNKPKIVQWCIEREFFIDFQKLFIASIKGRSLDVVKLALLQGNISDVVLQEGKRLAIKLGFIEIYDHLSG